MQGSWPHWEVAKMYPSSIFKSGGRACDRVSAFRGFIMWRKNRNLRGRCGDERFVST